MLTFWNTKPENTFTWFSGFGLLTLGTGFYLEICNKVRPTMLEDEIPNPKD